VILAGSPPPRITGYTLDGKRQGSVSLDRHVRFASLAFDSVAREFYVPLEDESAIGVFNLKGHLLRTLPVPATQNLSHVDVGERSLIRLF